MRLFIDGSLIELGRPEAVDTLLGLDCRLTGADFGGAAWIIITVVGRTNMPLPIAQSK
jgi:hypothetical protein